MIFPRLGELEDVVTEKNFSPALGRPSGLANLDQMARKTNRRIMVDFGWMFWGTNQQAVTEFGNKLFNKEDKLSIDELAFLTSALSGTYRSHALSIQNSEEEIRKDSRLQEFYYDFLQKHLSPGEEKPVILDVLTFATGVYDKGSLEEAVRDLGSIKNGLKENGLENFFDHPRLQSPGDPAYRLMEAKLTGLEYEGYCVAGILKDLLRKGRRSYVAAVTTGIYFLDNLAKGQITQWERMHLSPYLAVVGKVGQESKSEGTINGGQRVRVNDGELLLSYLLSKSSDYRYPDGKRKVKEISSVVNELWHGKNHVREGPSISNWLGRAYEKSMKNVRGRYFS